MLSAASPGIFDSPWLEWLLSGEHRFHLAGESDRTLGWVGCKPASPGGLSAPKNAPSTAPPPPRGGLTVQSGHKILQGFAVEGEGGGGISLLILLHRLHHQVGLGDTKCVCGGGLRVLPPSIPRDRHPSTQLTALQRFSGPGTCSISTKGWAKKHSKEMRFKGSLSKSCPKRSRHSGESRGRLGSWGGNGAETTSPAAVPSCENPPGSVPSCVTSTARSLRIFSSSSAKEREAKGGLPKSASAGGEREQRGEMERGKPAPQPTPGGNKSKSPP